MLLAALGSRLEVPEQVYKLIVLLLLLKVGLGAGISLREADPITLAAPAAVALGVALVLIGARSLAFWPGVGRMDGMATAGLFGAVSASTLAAGMAASSSDISGPPTLRGALPEANPSAYVGASMGL